MALIEIKVPSPGESITQVELYHWLVKDGDIVKKNAEIAELESDKATLMLVADQAGQIKLMAKEGDMLDVGSVACTIDTSVAHTEEEVKEEAAPAPKPAEEAKPAEPKAEKPQEAPKSDTKAKVSPLAQSMMDANNLSIDDVLNGLKRIKSEHVEAAMSAPQGGQSAQESGLKQPASRETTTEKMSSLRRKLSERLVSVKNETAMLTTFNEVDTKPIMDMRAKYQKKFVEKHEIKLGMMSFFVKACAIALKQFPKVNSMIDGENIVSFDYADISVAVSTPKGLMVPVVRNVESLGLAEIEKEIADLAKKARTGKITIPEMTGGTFTITNGGVFGSMLSTPIINPPQSAILGMHNIIERPVAVDGQVVIRPMMYVALSYDHRIIDGKDSVGFLVKVKELLENPTDMLFAGYNPLSQLLEI